MQGQIEIKFRIISARVQSSLFYRKMFTIVGGILHGYYVLTKWDTKRTNPPLLRNGRLFLTIAL
jgi:hypothetical protein